MLVALAALWSSAIGRVLITAGVAYMLGGIGGWRAHERLSSIGYYRNLGKAYELVIGKLKTEITTINNAARADQARAVDAAERAQQAEERAHELERQIGDGECFVGDDADRVRALWRQYGPGNRAERGKKRGPAAGAGRSQGVPGTPR